MQQIPEEITVGPQANFTLLDQASELKKTQSKRQEKVFLWFGTSELLVFSDQSDQTSAEKILEEEEKILQNVVETRGRYGEMNLNVPIFKPII